MAEADGQEKSGEVLQLLADGLTKEAVTVKLEIGVSSVYRIVKVERETSGNLKG